MKKRTFEEINEIYQKHVNEHKTLSELSREYGFNVSYYFKKYNLETFNWWKKDLNKRRELYHAYEIKNDLEVIDSEEKAYILGLWMSDGWVTDNEICIKIHKDDRQLIEKIRDFFAPEVPIKEVKNTVSFRLSSIKLVEQFNSYGCIKNKTYSEMHVPNISKELIRHFIRGYFDGDGTIFMDRKYYKSNICSICEGFLKELQKILTENYIESRINIEVREGKPLKDPDGKITTTQKNMYRLYVSKQAEILKFKDFMYRNSTIYLKRKFDKFPETFTE